MLNSTATKIIFSNNNGKKVATGVEFLYNNQKHTARVSKEVIVAGGAVNSPQILLLSGVGPKEDLNRVGIQQIHELPGVGKNLHNHVTFYMTYLLNNKKSFNDLDWANALDYILNRRGPMSSTGMSQVTARINSRYADPRGDHPDLQIFFAGYLANCAQSGEVKAFEDPEKPDAPKHLTVSPVVLHPKSRGYITLKSKDPLDSPLIYANYLTEPEDVATLVDGIRIIQRLGNTNVLKEKYGAELEKEDYGDCIKNYKYDSDEFWQCAVSHSTGPENHQAGSCKMGPASDSMAVVDPTLKVHGLENVRVMDASVMPMVVSGNTHATTVMIAEKGVDHIKNKWLGTDLENRFGENSSNKVPAANKPYYPHKPPNHQGGYHYRPGHPSFQHSPDFHNRHPHLPNPFNQGNPGYQPHHDFQRRNPNIPDPYTSNQNFASSNQSGGNQRVLSRGNRDYNENYYNPGAGSHNPNFDYDSRIEANDNYRQQRITPSYNTFRSNDNYNNQQQRLDPYDYSFGRRN